MLPSKLLLRSLTNLRCGSPRNRLFSSSMSGTENDNLSESGYAKAYTKFEKIITEDEEKTNETFSSLLRNSKFVDLGDPEGKLVTGRIFHVVEDDLYIDFGWKFHCVCTRPKKNATNYVRGAKVRLMIKELELSSKFLGFDKDLTLLEADCQLYGLVQERSSEKSKSANTS